MNYKMTKAEIEYSNKRQREVFGFNDEDLAQESNLKEYVYGFATVALLGLLAFLYLAVTAN